MKKFVAILLAVTLISTCLFTSCKDEEESVNESTSTSVSESVSESLLPKYTVSFENASLTSQTVEKGSSINKPNAPEKSGYVFKDWYLDGSFTQKAVFPFTVNGDVKFYAKYNRLYTITYANSTLQSQSVEEGNSINKPTAPEKTGYIFNGWYTDGEFKNKAEFPMTINADTSLYAWYTSYKQAFQVARQNTLEQPSFSYTYSMNMSVGLTSPALSLAGSYTGFTKYNASSTPSYYDECTNSGALLADGTTYKILRDTTMQTVKLDKNGILKDYSTEQVEKGYKVDTSSFAKAVFEYDDEKIKEIVKTTTPNVYELKTAQNASGIISMALNKVNNPIVEKIFGALPDTNATTKMLVTFNEGRISSYKYTMRVEVSAGYFDVEYVLNIDNTTTVTVPDKTFSGLSLSQSEIESTLSTVKGLLSGYKNKALSSYDLDIKTGVDYGALSAEINSTFDISTKRVISSGIVYFFNDIEIDSDYKNKDLYDAKNVKDTDIKCSRVSNGNAYYVEKPIIGAYKSYDMPSGKTKDAVDYFGFLPDSMLVYGNVGCIQKTTESGKTTYSVDINKNGVMAMLNFINDSFDYDPEAKATVDVKTFGSYLTDGLTVKEATMNFVFSGSDLVSINVEGKGRFTTKFEDSRDFYVYNEAAYDFNYELKVTNESFEIIEYKPAK